MLIVGATLGQEPRLNLTRFFFFNTKETQVVKTEPTSFNLCCCGILGGCVCARARTSTIKSCQCAFASLLPPPSPPACSVYLDHRSSVFCPWLKCVSRTGDDDLDDALSDVDEVPKSKKKKKAKKSSRESRSSKRQRPIREVSLGFWFCFF